MKKLFSEIPCIKGDRLVMRRVTRADADEDWGCGKSLPTDKWIL